MPWRAALSSARFVMCSRCASDVLQMCSQTYPSMSRRGLSDVFCSRRRLSLFSTPTLKLVHGFASRCFVASTQCRRCETMSSAVLCSGNVVETVSSLARWAASKESQATSSPEPDSTHFDFLDSDAGWDCRAATFALGATMPLLISALFYLIS